MKILISGILFLITVFALFASGDYDSIVYMKNANIALEGYDTVAYFESDKAVEGSLEWKTMYKGAEWLFSSEYNLNLFLSNPDKFAPAYGGYCAWAMNDGKLAPGRPDLWDIIDGILYLNYSKSTRKKFLANIDSMIKNADTKWPQVEEELLRRKSS